MAFEGQMSDNIILAGEFRAQFEWSTRTKLVIGFDNLRAGALDGR